MRSQILNDNFLYVFTHFFNQLPEIQVGLSNIGALQDPGDKALPGMLAENVCTTQQTMETADFK